MFTNVMFSSFHLRFVVTALFGASWEHCGSMGFVGIGQLERWIVTHI